MDKNLRLILIEFIVNWSLRLLDFKTQEIYYEIMIDRYMHYCARLGQENSLTKAFAALSLKKEEVIINNITSITVFQQDRELSILTMAMRKIREAIVASSRTDAFALKAYLFIIRAAILTKQMESYHPALLHLLSQIHPTSPLSSLEYHEFMGYHILDLACRQKNLAQAYDVRNRTGYKDAHVETTLQAIVHGNWYKFWNAHKSADDYQKRLMEWYSDDVRKHVLKCFGKTYLVVDKSFVETATASSLERLLKENSLCWEVDGEAVTIRRIKMK